MTQARLLDAEILDLVGELAQHGIAQLAGYSSAQALLVDALRVAPRHATKMVQRAAAITETVTPTGHTQPAPLPTTREALRDGVIDGDHIDAITSTMQQIPDSVDLATRELVETTLADTARTENPYTVRRHGQILLQHLDPDGKEPTEPTVPANSFTFRRNRSGTMTFRGHLEPETAELLEQMLDKEAVRTAEPALDPRPLPERWGDALADIVHRAANPQGGAKAVLTICLNINDLIGSLGTATLDSGCQLHPATVRQLACDADVIPMVLNGQSVPLDAGRTRRLVTAKQRAALVARDKGCAFPGCGNPARWADAHHIHHWIDGGRTDLDNTVLLCRRHHRLLHHSAWQVRITKGLPEFIPPTWIDPHQLPRRSTLHRRP